MTSHPKPALERAWPWIIRFGGLAIAFYETLFENADRPSLLLLAAGMLGLPEFVKFQRRNGNGMAK